MSVYTSTLNPIVGEGFDLFISSNQPFQHEPNTQALNKNFEIFGLSKSSQIKIINGKTHAEYQWILSLSAKKSGQIIIPAIYVGKDKTHAISLNVIKNSIKAINPQGTVELTVKTSPKTIYPQQQLIYTAILKIAQSMATRLKNASLSLPQVENAIIKPLGHDKKYQQQIKNTTYTIIERRYAIFPQHSGKLEIKAPIFRGEIEDLHAQSFSLPFGFSGQEIKRTAPTLTLTIQPAPKQHQTAWLPAKKLTLHSHWEQEPPIFQVGTPITRVITIEATGLLSSQLPNTQLNLDKANVYSEKPILKDTEKGNNIIGSRQDSFAVIPTQPGKLVLPKIQIKWWNITKKRFEVTTLKKEVIHIKAVAKPNVAPTHQKTQKITPDSTLKQSANNTSTKLISTSSIWPPISITSPSVI
ncbi:BatD family protein [Piscirickettsia salmonis]|uniref:BatD family protein n=1 Tax=Piscirickettsia salmonis TaxID=1238 RepID=UPI0018ACE84B|nr:BatD family protein [Piscirickettsia salmonis]QGP53901.1 hypothetical protein PsalSR1_01325 [Piscirickettsia salmonis]QGP60202.1 hypothetical protein PsalBI1_02807 [Piscirickettsia salmonis]